MFRFKWFGAVLLAWPLDVGCGGSSSGTDGGGDVGDDVAGTGGVLPDAERSKDMICHVTVMTGSLQESIEFYQWLLGLPVARRFPYGDGGEIAFLGAEETKLELIYAKDHQPTPGNDITLGFAVPDLDEKIALLDSRNFGHSPVLSPGPGMRFCFFTDLNGVRVQLFEGH